MCRNVMERLTAYLDGGLPDGERDLIDAHLSECDGCDAALDQFRITIEVTGTLREDDVSSIDPGVRDELVAAFRARTG